MKEAIQNLLQLQTIDRKLDTLERAKGDLPQKVQQVKSELEKARETLQNNESSLTELQKELRRVELEISTLNTKKKKSEEQLYAVQTNKEYDAVTLEIEQAIEKIDAMENSEIELLDKEKDASEQVKLAKEALAKMEDDFQKTSVKLAKTIEANADKEKSLTEERKSIANKIKVDYLRIYERIRKPKAGLPLVTIERGACGGCYTNIPPQRVMEVRESDRLILCEHCGRILYWQDEEELTIK